MAAVAWKHTPFTVLMIANIPVHNIRLHFRWITAVPDEQYANLNFNTKLLILKSLWQHSRIIFTLIWRLVLNLHMFLSALEFQKFELKNSKLFKR